METIWLLSMSLLAQQVPFDKARLASQAQSFAEQGRVARMLALADDRLNPDRLTSSPANLALGLLFAGLALVASSVLFA